MNLRTLIRRSRRFHRRANFALLLGVAVGTAVLTGALLVGDSLRGSLRERALANLCGIRHVMSPGRFVNPDFGNDSIQRFIYLPASANANGRTASNLIVHDNPTIFLDRHQVPTSWDPSWRIWEAFRFVRNRSLPAITPVTRMLSPGVAVVSQTVSRELGVAQGDTITVSVPRTQKIAPDSPLGRKNSDEAKIRVDLPIHEEADSSFLVNFNINPAAAPSRSIYVDRQTLESHLGETGTANLFVSVDQSAPKGPWNLTVNDYGLPVRAAASLAASLLTTLDRDQSGSLEPREYRRRLAEVTVQQADANNDKTLTRGELQNYFRKKGYFALESDSLLLSPAAEKAALAAADKLGLKAAPTMVYLANSISDGTNAIPYSVVAALDPQLPPPLGPFLDPKEKPLADDEILLVDWPESPLSAKPGDKVTLTYFLPESEGKATEATATFKVRAKVPLTGVAADPDLTPAFPGITDKLSLGEWDPPFPYDNSKIKKSDEDFWDKYRATPKAYINPAAGRKLFGSRFGYATSIRIAAKSPDSIEDDAKDFETELLKQINPADFGFVFEDVRARALAASQGGTDFGGLFLGFSFFLIAAALLLVALLVRLAIDRRAGEVGLLLAAGFQLQAVRRLLLREYLGTTIWGALWGLALAIGYGWLMLQLLAWMWPEGSVGSFLQLHVEWSTLVVGFVGSVLMAFAAVWWALRTLNNISCVQLLRGTAATTESSVTTRRWLIVVSALLGIASIVTGLMVHGHEARAGSFFAGGGLFLVAGLLMFRAWLRQGRGSSPTPSMVRLGIHNAARNPSRSLLTAGLLAAASFLLIAVESFRRSPEADFARKTGGSGGFQFVATTELPIYQDPNDPTTGRKELLETLQREYQKDPTTQGRKLAAATQLLEATTFIPIRVRAGDDAGCRNLYRPDQPRLLGVPKRFIERGGFHFAKSLENIANPWELLNRRDGDAIPVFGEANTVAWMLHKALGDTLEVTDSKGEKRKLQIVGLLQDSIFQGELLMAEARLLELYPETSGYGMLLIETPADQVDDARSVIDSAFAERGLTVTPSIDRLRSYLAVENTYLSTFQVLGAFGLLLGACGLAVVMLRSMWERRGELALLRAVGFQSADLRKMVLAEIIYLVLVGLGLGVAAALASVLPQRITGQAVHLPWLPSALMLLSVVAIGLLTCLVALRGVLRAPIVAALRSE
jgi:ABC-type lipoprotein release transport system permease subunit